MFMSNMHTVEVSQVSHSFVEKRQMCWKNFVAFPLHWQILENFDSKTFKTNSHIQQVWT